MFTQLKVLLPRATQKHCIERTVTASLICEIFRQIRSEVLGNTLADMVQPKFFRNHTLTLSVLSSPMAQEIYFHKIEIIEAINRRLERNFVTEIRTHIENS